MSGITGIFWRNGRDVDPVDIKKMNDKIAHRGPDGSRVWCEGPVAFGHQMLHTTQESLHEKLPFDDKESGLSITADARIDNRKDLAPLLGIEDNEYVSDSYFILKAYEKWGEKCPEELLGDFSFAIWDKNRNKLFCARDHMGIKPFYYHLTNDLFLFGTEIKSILSYPLISKHLNKTRISDYLLSLFEDKEITFYEEINRLPAAQTLTLYYNNSSFNEYWVIDLNETIYYDSNEDYSEKFLSIFNESVACRLRSAFPIGSTLSGGLDSSSIVCAAQKILNNNNNNINLNTFSAIFSDVPETDESKFINTVLKEYNVYPNFLHADKISPLSNLDDVLWHLDEPLYPPNLFIHWNLYDNANKSNIRIILDGYDGDSTLSHGEKYLVEKIRNKEWKNIIHEVRCQHEKLGLGIDKVFLHHILFPSLPIYIKSPLKSIISYINRIQYGKNNINGMKFNENFLDQIDVFQRYDSLLKYKNTINPREYHYLNIKSGIHQFVLEVLDKSSAAFSIEPRYPFFDKRLIEFCILIPTEQKISNGWDRIILRRSMENILPKEIQWRPKKSNLGPNFERSFILYETNTIQEVFSSFEDSHIQSYLDKEGLDNIFEGYKNLKKGKTVYNTWKLVNLAIWLDKYYYI